jgi:NADH/NAD ratio-sensing transcriptional regulator Rex
MKSEKYEIDSKISDSTIRRLSTYHRTLSILESAGIETISSKKLADIENITFSALSEGAVSDTMYQC